MPQNSMPDNWQPPAPAWQGDWKNTDIPLIVGYFGIQADSPDKLETWAQEALYGLHAPLRVEQSAYTDQANITNYVFICYWRNDEYQKWWGMPPHCGWWQDKKRLEDGVGYWREIISMPHERFETLNSSTEPHGVSAVADNLVGPIEEHGYDGGMRDRIALSDDQSLRNTFDTSNKASSNTSDGGRRVVVYPPENTCVIRSGQNWSDCDDEQAAFYVDKVHPVLQKGMRFFRDNPVDTHCYCMRFMDTKDTHWRGLKQSFGLGYGTDIYAFEDWAKSHPTHIAILQRFMEMVGNFGENLQLKLWHEVTVLPKDGCEFEYLCCHKKTGLLNYI